MKATARDLRFHSKEILESISRGEEVTITYRGKDHAKVIPLNQNVNSRFEKNGLFGIWKDHARIKNVSRYLRRLRQGRFYVD